MGNECKLWPNDEKKIELDTEYKDTPRRIFPELDDIRKKIKELEIFERPKIAKKKFTAFMKKEKGININNEIIKKDYIEISELLYLNDTDKDIVKLYLNFIKRNNEFIKNYGLKTFHQELQKYCKLFEVEEMNEIEENYKNKSEKINFF